MSTQEVSMPTAQGPQKGDKTGRLSDSSGQVTLWCYEDAALVSGPCAIRTQLDAEQVLPDLLKAAAEAGYTVTIVRGLEGPRVSIVTSTGDEVPEGGAAPAATGGAPAQIPQTTSATPAQAKGSASSQAKPPTT